MEGSWINYAKRWSLWLLLACCSACAEKAVSADTAKLGAVCQKGDAGLCYRLGIKEIPSDPKQALAYTSLACERGLHLACYNVGVLQEFGIGTPASAKQAFVSYLSACEQGHQLACSHGATMHLFGAGTRKNVAAANQLLAQSCKQEVLERCVSQAKQQAQQFGLEAEHVIAAQCRKGWLQNCLHLGIAYQQAIGFKKNLAQAHKYYALACKNGHKKACQLIPN